jgi:hypothetical protein
MGVGALMEINAAEKREIIKAAVGVTDERVFVKRLDPVGTSQVTGQAITHARSKLTAFKRPRITICLKSSK